MQENASAGSLDRTVRVMQEMFDNLTGTMADSLIGSAERLQLASRIAREQARSDAFRYVLETITQNYELLTAQLEGAENPVLRTAIEHQIQQTSLQAADVLEKMGVARPQAAAVTQQVLLPASDLAVHTTAEDGTTTKTPRKKKRAKSAAG